MVRKNGKIVHITKAFSRKVRNMGRAITGGLMVVLIMVYGNPIILKATGLTTGPMEGNMMVFGKITNYMVQESILGQMEGNMMELMKTIRSKVLVFMYGLMVASM